ncbi:dehydrogenase [Saccharomonospora sp. CUA-673]|uniref:NADP-dependent oxidoreductase n=1 Tax=Saccharomonospora sp. CUA-673 TaxID=1904969 RepID=UPI00095F3B0D|nr:NADP-dependent oxidoreductase [Saccharomonospora sp. CUA-673]OLT43233.1 dehydrogenase [Saccharomonospora sp. CUA-673]
MIEQGTSRRAVVRRPSGPEATELVEVPVPDPGAGQIRVRIAAAAVNPVDVGVAGGVFHELGLVNQPEYTGLGWDFAGTVEAAGAGVDLPLGTRIAGFVDGFDRDHGAHAEHLVVDATQVAVVPNGLDLVTAAAVPLTATAAAQLVDLLGEPSAGGDRLVVTGAAGAVGAYVAVLARERGWRVTGVARPADERFVRGLGVEFAPAPDSASGPDSAAGSTDTAVGVAADAVADAAAMQRTALRYVRDGGRFVGVQPAAPPPEERGIAVGVVVARPDGPLLARLLDRVAAGELPVRVEATMSLEDVVPAYRRVAAGGVRGRIVLVRDRSATAGGPP